MTYSVYQHWDPLVTCVVGRSYPPEFYSWITVPHVRELFEKIAIETEEDYQGIIRKLKDFGVEVLRPNLPNFSLMGGKYCPPPMTPRDHVIMIGQDFYHHFTPLDYHMANIYQQVRDPSWPDCHSRAEFWQLPQRIQDECLEVHDLGWATGNDPYEFILQHVRDQGNTVNYTDSPVINGAMVSRIGKDLYFGTPPEFNDQKTLASVAPQFPNYRTHVINTAGHSDGTYCPVCPGLIISLFDVPNYANTYPEWEVVYLPNQSWQRVKDFLTLKKKNQGKWWIPGYEHDQQVIATVETWLQNWVGYVEETVFDVNMLIIDPKNVLVFNYNKQVFDALERYGMTAHVTPFRHRYFWDGGIHCVTADLDRRGHLQDFFPERN